MLTREWVLNPGYVPFLLMLTRELVLAGLTAGWSVPCAPVLSCCCCCCPCCCRAAADRLQLGSCRAARRSELKRNGIISRRLLHQYPSPLLMRGSRRENGAETFPIKLTSRLATGGGTVTTYNQSYFTDVFVHFNGIQKLVGYTIYVDEEKGRLRSGRKGRLWAVGKGKTQNTIAPASYRHLVRGAI